jgi:hypothetical protein
MTKSFVTVEKGSGKSSIALASTASDLQRFELSQVAQVILSRGFPGSGKATKAKVLMDIGYRHFDAGMIFEADGVFRSQFSQETSS